MSQKKKILLLGGLLMDRYVRTDQYPNRGEDTLIREEFLRVGGCPFNAASTLAALGAEPVIYSALGEDEMAREIRRTVEETGLSQEALYTLPGERTGYCMIVLDSQGERTFFTFRGCEGHFDPGRISPSLLGDTAAIFATGIYLLYPQWSERAVSFLEQAAGQGIPVLFDPGSLIGEMDLDLLWRVVKTAGIVTPNQWERRELERLLGLESFPRWIAARGGACIETRGARGALLTTEEGERWIPPCRASVVDTTGTGDSFAGGVLAAVQRGVPLAEAARTGSACGALTAETVGSCRDLSWAAVEERLAEC